MLFVMPQTIKTLLKMFHNWAGKTRGKTHLVLARKERERKPKKKERENSPSRAVTCVKLIQLKKYIYKNK